MNKITTRFATLRTFITSLVIVLSLITSASNSNAAPLPIGGIHFPVYAEPGPVGATFVSTTGAVPFATANYTGTLTSTVYSNDPTSPYPTGLTFTYLLHNDSTSPDALERITIVNFDSYLTDVSYQTPVGLDVVPSYVDRSGPGGSIGFSFAPYTAFGKLNPGKTSTLLVVQTDATGYFSSIASVIDGLAVQVGSYAPGVPTNIVPEPGTIGLSAIGFGVVAFFARRRKVNA